MKIDLHKKAPHSASTVGSMNPGNEDQGSCARNLVGSTWDIDLYVFRRDVSYVEWRVYLLSHMLKVYKGR